jgi:hypothetical protein
VKIERREAPAWLSKVRRRRVERNLALLQSRKNGNMSEAQQQGAFAG